MHFSDYLLCLIDTEKPSVGMVLKAVLVNVLSWLVAVLVNVLTALLLGLTGRSMSWFTHTRLLFPLYIVPAILAMAEVHSFWQKNVHRKCHLKMSSSVVYALHFPKA